MKHKRGQSVIPDREMIYLPPLRRLLLPVILLVSLIIAYKALPLPTSLPSLVLRPGPAPPRGIRVPKSSLQKPLPLANASNNHLSPPNRYFYSYDQTRKLTNKSVSAALWQPVLDSNLSPLFACARKINKYTGHFRLPNIIQNISAIAPGLKKAESRVFWNPTIISLPYWSENQYLVVSRIVTDGNHQENVLCEANVCSVGSGQISPGDRACTQDDLQHVGPAGGMRCVHPPVTLSVPPTPADKCEGKFESYVDIPGFHDPRLFWSGRGEPLMMINTQ